MCGTLQLSALEKMKSELAGKVFVGKAIETCIGAPFNGFMRTESMDAWRDKIISEHFIAVDGFSEKGHWFNRPGKIKACKVNDYNGKITARVVTMPADNEVLQKSGHDRMPVIC